MSLRNLEQPSTITSKFPGVVYADVTDQLPKNPKNTWAQLAGVRDISDLTTIALHHDAYPKKNTANASDMQLLSDMAKDHINNLKYDPTGEGGVPYHIWIRSGRIYQCNDLLDRTYGVGSNNAYTIHICVSGDYFKYDQLTDADRNALYMAILLVINVLPQYKEIKAHKEFPENFTDCPGYNHQQVRDDIAKLQLQIKSESDPVKVKEKCFVGTNQHNYLYAEYTKDPVANKWMEPWLMELEQLMRDRGMFFDK